MLAQDENIVVYYEGPVFVDETAQERKINLYVVPTLEEAALDFQSGEAAAFDYLMKYYKPKLEYNICRFKDEDIFQELSIVLHHCALNYRPGGNTCFNTLFWTAAQNRIGAVFSSRNAKKRQPTGGLVSLNATVDGDSNNKSQYEELIEDVAVQDSYIDVEFNDFLLNKILPSVSPTDKAIIEKTLQGYKVTTIAKEMGVTTACIYSHYRKLRRNKFLQELNSF